MVDDPATPTPTTATKIPISSLRQLRGVNRKEGWGTNVLSLEELEEFLSDLIKCQMGAIGKDPLISTPFEPRSQAENLFLKVEIKRYDDPSAGDWLYLSDVANLLDQTQLFLVTNFAGKNSKIINQLVAHPHLKRPAIDDLYVDGDIHVSEQKAFDHRKDLFRRAELLAEALRLLRNIEGEESVFKSAKDALSDYLRSHNLVNSWGEVVLPVAKAYQKTEIGSVFVTLEAITGTSLTEGQYIVAEFPDVFDLYTELLSDLVKNKPEVADKLDEKLKTRLKDYRNQDFYFQNNPAFNPEQKSELQHRTIRLFIEFFTDVIKYLIGDKEVEVAAAEAASEATDDGGGETETEEVEEESTGKTIPLADAVNALKQALLLYFLDEFKVEDEVQRHPQPELFRNLVADQFALAIAQALDLEALIKAAEASTASETTLIRVFNADDNTINLEIFNNWLTENRAELLRQFSLVQSADVKWLANIYDAAYTVSAAVNPPAPDEKQPELATASTTLRPELIANLRQKNLIDTKDDVAHDEAWWREVPPSQKFTIITEVLGGSQEIGRFETVFAQFALANNPTLKGLEFSALPPELREQLTASALSYLGSISFDEFNKLDRNPSNKNAFYLSVLRRLQPHLESLDSLVAYAETVKAEQVAAAEKAAQAAADKEAKAAAEPADETPAEPASEPITPDLKIPSDWSDDKKQLIAELQKAGITAINAKVLEDTVDLLLLQNENLIQTLAALTPADAQKKFGIALSSDPQQAAKQLLAVKELMTRFVEIRRRELLTKVKPALAKEQDDLFKLLSDEFGLNEAEQINLQNGVDTLVILSRDPAGFIGSLTTETAGRYLGVSFKSQDQATQLDRLKALLLKYAKYRQETLAVEGFLEKNQEVSHAFFLTRELINSYGNPYLIRHAFYTQYGEEADVDELKKLDDAEKQSYREELNLRKAIVEELWRELVVEEKNYFYELYPMDQMAMSAAAIPGAVSAADLMSTLEQRPDYVSPAQADSEKQSLRQRLSRRLFKKSPAEKVKQKTINKALSRAARKLGLDKAVSKAAAALPVVGAMAKLAEILGRLTGTDSKKIMMALVAMPVSAFGSAVGLATYSLGGALGGALFGGLGAFFGGPTGALIGFTGGAHLGHHIIPNSLSSIFGTSTGATPVAGIPMIPAFAPVVTLGSLAVGGMVINGIMTQSYLGPMPTISNEGNRDISLYAEIEKESQPGVSFDLPNDIAYSIKMRAKPGYILQVIEPPTDEITITYNEEENPSGNPEIPNSPEYEAFTESLATFGTEHPEITTEWVEVGSYTIPFSTDEEGYNHANVRNKFSVTVRVLDEYGAVVKESEPLSTGQVICFGNCPQLSNGCWPTTGTIRTLPFGDRHAVGLDVTQGEDAFDISAPSGSDIYAPFAGKACPGHLSDSSEDGYGNHVILEVPGMAGPRGETGTLYLIFAHMVLPSDTVPSTCIVLTEEDVAEGFVLGHVGTSGNSTGNHLHYEARWNSLAWEGTAISPSLLKNYVPEPEIEVSQTVRSCHE